MTMFGRALACLAAPTLILVMVGTCLADEAPFSRRVAVQAVALSNELLETTVTEEVVVKSQSAVQTFGQLMLPVNMHFHDQEILEAATVKADGRRVPVSPDRILTSALPNAPQRGLFEADATIRTIVYPDLAVGDTIRSVTRITDKQRGLPGGFTLHQVVARSSRFDQYSVALDVPAELKLHVSAVGFSQTSEQHGNRRVITWTLQPQPYRPEEPGAVAPVDREARVIASSYPDWEAVGRKFFDDAAPMSVPTPEIRALADDITKGITDRREQASAVFDWVSKNVRYFAIFLGQGSFVPHPAGEVLANKYGDCKDHVTLMRALLAAKGIEADYVLINTNPVYQDYAIPAPEWFNHAILYLPDFDSYADPTSAQAAFGVIPFYEADKPILRMGRHGVRLTRTPALSAATNIVSVHADVTLRADGTVVGGAATAASGSSAMGLRQVAAAAANKGGSEYANERLAAFKWHGTGTVQQRDPTDHAEPYVVKTTFNLTNDFLKSSHNDNVLPEGPLLLGAGAFAGIRGFIDNRRTEDFSCAAQTYNEVIDFRPPEGRTLVDVPSGKDLKSRFISYKSSYRLDGNVLHVERRVIVDVPHEVCTAAMAKEMASVVAAAAQDFDYHPQFAAPAAKD